MIVAVTVRHVRLPCGEVRAHEADGGGAEEHAHCHRPFVAGAPSQTRLHRVHSYVSVGHKREPSEWSGRHHVI